MRKLVLLALVGLAAQLVDGSLGMGYGVTSATLLVAGGLGPAAASAAIHFSEIGTSLVSGISHHALGNIDWRTVGDPRGARLRRRLRRRDAAGQPRRRPRRPGGRRDPARARHLRHLAVPHAAATLPLPAATRRRGSSRRSAWSPARSTRSAAVAGARSAPRRRRCSPPAGSSRARSSARSTPPSSWSRSAARSASWSRSAARASTGRSSAALLVGGVIAAPIAAALVRYLPPGSSASRPVA